MTYSIAGMDPKTGEIGIAVHSKVFSLGGIVAFVKADVGAVATQSLVNVSLGPLGLELLGDGRSPEQVLEHFKEMDEGIHLRQLGILSVKDGPLSFTGDKCIAWAGGKTGENFTCQGNILTGSDVIDAMAEAFEQTPGYLIEKLMATLEAAEAKGGDARGSQSAIIVIEEKGKGRAGYGDRKVELRVDDQEDPIAEMRRLVEIQLLYDNMQRANELAGEDIDEAISILEKALGFRTDRVTDEAWLTLATLHFRKENLGKAIECVEKCVNIHPGMKGIIRQYPALGAGFDENFINSIEVLK
ncbi:MAG: DUF1028 domain-containing protein [Candidatus Kariarchaeaceae archaeon]|jgi:uncharacterized Ntn-hydrolase superfamily protein